MGSDTSRALHVDVEKAHAPRPTLRPIVRTTDTVAPNGVVQRILLGKAYANRASQRGLPGATKAEVLEAPVNDTMFDAAPGMVTIQIKTPATKKVLTLEYPNT